MKIKGKYIYTTILLSPIVLAFAQNYSVVILKDQNNKYNVDTYTSTGEIVCESKSPLSNEFYKGFSFEQNHSNCQEKVTFSNGNIIWKDIPDYTDTQLGEVVLNSCKEILNNNYSVGSQNYILNINDTEQSVYCDMVTDGGGWSLVSSPNIVNQIPYATNTIIDDLNLSYSEVLYNHVSGLSDLAYPYGNASWDWEGFDLGKNILRFNNTWRNASGYFVNSCNTIPESDKLPVSSYRIIERNLTLCYDGETNNLNNCGTKVVITKPANTRLTGFGDIESVSQTTTGCNSNNGFNYKAQLFVR